MCQTDDEDSSPNSSYQSPKGLLKVKPPGVSPKKLMPGSPQWHRKRTSKIPRPPNAFMIFANEYRRKLAFDNPKENNKEISCRLGTMWKNLAPDVKESYYTQSREADEEHKRKYPGYYYSPKEARIRKNLKADMAGARRAPRVLDPNYLLNVVMPDEINERTAPPPQYLLYNPPASPPSPPPPKQLQKIAPKVGGNQLHPAELVTCKLEDGRDTTDVQTAINVDANQPVAGNVDGPDTLAISHK